VGCIEIRNTPKRKLIIRQEDHRDRYFFLVTGTFPSYILHGGALGDDVMGRLRPDGSPYWKDDLNHPELEWVYAIHGDTKEPEFKRNLKPIITALNNHLNLQAA
jgi:hypothetical protein